MHVENESYADLIIEKGRFTAESSWIFTADDSTYGNGVLLESAREWAGKIGEPLKIPTADGRHFTGSKEFKVTRIEFEMLDRRRCRIRFLAGIPIETEEEEITDTPVDSDGINDSGIWQCREYTEERKSDGAIYRIGVWKFCSEKQAAVFPAVGQIFLWEEESFVCTACEIDLCCKSCTVTARKIVTLMLNGVTSGFDKDRIAEKEVTYFVAANDYESFMSQHISGTEAQWAGKDYFLCSIESKPFGIVGFEVTLKAREVYTRQLEVLRNESFAGFHWTGGMRSAVAMQAKYQVRSGDLAAFRSLVGSAAEWAEPGMIVADIREEKRSAVEYMITLEACLPKFLAWQSGDDDVYDGRVDCKVDVSELFISAAMAGYVQNPEGKYEEIPDWNAERSCPLLTSKALSRNYINSVVRTMEITMIEYIRGSCKFLLDDMQEWSNSRLDYGKNVKGNALRIRQTGSDVREKDGTVYAKLTRVYQMPPAEMNWNSSYWSGL